MSVLFRVAAACCLLSACTSSHPDGAYDPENLDIRANVETYDDDGGEGDSSIPVQPDAGPPPEQDELPETLRLRPLEGYYLVRIDGYTHADVPTAIGRASIKTRASQLLVTQLTASQGKLVGRERLCHQLVENVCSGSCKSFVTTLLPRARELARARFYERSYSVDTQGMLTTNPVVMQLGFTNEGNPNALPTTQDETVWDSYPNTGREGMITKAVVTPSFGPPIECHVFNTQRFVTSFSAQLKPAALSLVGAPWLLDTHDSSGKIVGSNGATDCGNEPNPLPTTRKKEVRFARVDDLGEAALLCPELSVYEARGLEGQSPDAI